MDELRPTKTAITTGAEIKLGELEAMLDREARYQYTDELRATVEAVRNRLRVEDAVRCIRIAVGLGDLHGVVDAVFASDRALVNVTVSTAEQGAAMKRHLLRHAYTPGLPIRLEDETFASRGGTLGRCVILVEDDR